MLLINNSPQEQRPLVPLDAKTLGQAANLGAAGGEKGREEEKEEGSAVGAARFAVRDIWERAEVGVFSGRFAPRIPAYDSGFFLLTPAAVQFVA